MIHPPASEHNVMKKILVFTSDIVPLGNIATSGGGLRSWQIIKGLEERGFDVTYSMPRDCFLRRISRNDLPEEHVNRLWTHTNQDGIIQGVQPDVIVCVNPTTRNWKEDYSIPVAVDFAGPNLLEYEAMNNRLSYRARFALVTRKMLSVARADFFTCAGCRQRYYFMAFLLMAGIEVADLEIHHMPMAMSPHLPARHRDESQKSILFAGGFYPWLDPMPGLADLASVLGKIRDGRLDIYGGSHETNPEEKKAFERFRSALSANPRVAFHGFIPWEELVHRYTQAYVAFELIPRNLERELAFTCRTLACLWAGLPVIYNDYSELSDLIAEYQAGWIVPVGDSEVLEETVRLVLADPDMVEQRSKNAQRLVAENFVYDKVIGPLAQFCENPFRRKRCEQNNYLIIPTRRPGYGYVDAVYSAYKRSSSASLIRELFRGAFGVIKKKLQA